MWIPADFDSRGSDRSLDARVPCPRLRGHAAGAAPVGSSRGRVAWPRRRGHGTRDRRSHGLRSSRRATPTTGERPGKSGCRPHAALDSTSGAFQDRPRTEASGPAPSTRQRRPRVRYRPRCHRPPSFPTRLLPAFAGLLVLVTAGPLSAASVSAGGGTPARGSAHHCKCGTKCRGASCCCDSHGDAAHPAEDLSPQAEIPSEPASSAPLGPCLNALPCGDPGVPLASPVESVVKTAALGRAVAFDSTDAGAALPCESAPSRPRQFGERIDEPPEA
jgi:hypothetical protein